MIVRGDKSIIPALQAIATGQSPSAGDPGSLARIHALWALEGLQAIDKDVLFRAFTDKDPQVRRSAVWISECYSKKNDEQVINKLAELKNDPSYDVRVQLLLSLCNSKSARAKALVKEISDNNQGNEMLAAIKTALDKNEDQRTYSKKLGNLAMNDKSVILNGMSVYKSLCANCHGADGRGLVIGGSGMAAPPLVESKRLSLNDRNTTIRILLHGLTGPVDGKEYSSVMPAMGANNDRWIASVVSYIRYEMVRNNRNKKSNAVIVKSEDVKKIRNEDSARNRAWTLTELESRSKTDTSASTASP